MGAKIGFESTVNLAYPQKGGGLLQGGGLNGGFTACSGCRMPKRKYRSENFGQDDGIIEKSYWVPSSKVACVASVSSRGSSRKLGQEQKKHK